MINNYIKNICLIVFALVGPISLPAGGIQRSIHTNLNDKSNEIIINSNKNIYFYPEKKFKKNFFFTYRYTCFSIKILD